MLLFLHKKHKRKFESDNRKKIIMLFVLLCLIVACATENELWKKYATECVSVEKSMYSDSIIDRITEIILNYDEIETVRAKLEKTLPPTENELVSLLESNDPNDKKIALVTIDVKHCK